MPEPTAEERVQLAFPCDCGECWLGRDRHDPTNPCYWWDDIMQCVADAELAAEKRGREEAELEWINDLCDECAAGFKPERHVPSTGVAWVHPEYLSGCAAGHVHELRRRRATQDEGGEGEVER